MRRAQRGRAGPRRGRDPVGPRGPRPQRRGVSARGAPARAEDLPDGDRSPSRSASPGASEWVDAEHVGWAPPGEEAPLRFDVAAGPRPAAGRPRPGTVRRGRARARGVRRRGPDRVRGATPHAARRRRRAPSPPSTSSERRCSPPSATTCAPPWPGSRRASARSARPTSSGRTRSARSCWRRSRTRPTGSTRSSATSSTRAGCRREPLVVRTEAVALDEVVSAAIARPARGQRPGRGRGSRGSAPGPCRSRTASARASSTSSTTRSATGAARSRSAVKARAGAESAKIEIVDHGPGRAQGTRGGAVRAVPERRRSQRRQGLGLGLSVARGFVEAMGGAMVADQTPGGGMTMRIRLELDEATAAPRG